MLILVISKGNISIQHSRIHVWSLDEGIRIVQVVLEILVSLPDEGKAEYDNKQGDDDRYEYRH